MRTVDAARCGKACQEIEVEMIGHRMEERGDSEGDEAEPGGLGELSHVPRGAAASDAAPRSRGGRQAGREESEKEAETGESEVYRVLEIDIVDRAPGRPDLLMEGQ